MKKKILLIDDSRTQLSTLKIFFTKAGFDVETANDGIEGYEQIFKFVPDIIFSDVTMPNLNGYQFCRLVKDSPLTKVIPCVLLTVLDQKIDKFWSKKSGADMFIMKSDNFAHMIAAAEGLIEQNPVSAEDKKKIEKYSGKISVNQESINKILDDSLMQTSILNEFRLLATDLENSEIMVKKLFDLFDSILDFDSSFLILKSGSASEKNVFTCGISDEKLILREFLDKACAGFFPEKQDYLIKSVFVEGKNLVELDELSIKNIYVHPVEYLGETIGVLCLLGSTQQIDFEQQRFFNLVMNEVDLLVTVHSLYVQNKILSLTDSLTGLFNRRYLLDILDREYARAKRYGSTFSIVLLDLDYFKNVNDTYGHQAGDYVLKEIGSYIKKTVRKSDIIFRYGGEEILAILPETSQERAVVPFERIRKFIENNEFVYNGNVIKMTVSAGIVDTSQQSNDLNELVEYADKAMYKAKQLGRNRIELYNE